ncbi:MAG: hypothetical protein JST12_03430 [Armatimonadetes bacterium]|nr:hypothetical protein [Armatimonadota bacterium]
MLWRKHYETRILRDLPCPVTQLVALDGDSKNYESEVWIGGIGFAALAEQEVWWRLFQSDFPNDERVRRVFVVESADAKTVETALSLIPPSQSSRTLLALDLNQAWQRALETDQGLTALIEGGRIPLAMTGPPTEDAWELFHDEWKLRT